jgi:hypothetical protein
MKLKAAGILAKHKRLTMTGFEKLSVEFAEFALFNLPADRIFPSANPAWAASL